LRILFLDNNQISDLSPLFNLTNLGGTHPTHIPNYKGPGGVSLRENPITLEQVNELQKALPKCTITHSLTPDFVIGRILPGDYRNASIGDALEILKYLAKMKSLVK